MAHKAVNWNKKNDGYTQAIFNQNTRQVWFPEEINTTGDKNTWITMTSKEHTVFKRVLGGLTLLDTKQGAEGMPLISMHTEDLQAKATLSFQGAMEHVHAKSYSNIFTTLATNEEIDEIFTWVEGHKNLQFKADVIVSYYDKLFKKNPTKREIYMAHVASTFLESYLFYSGFFYPLFLAGQGKLTASGEIINLIVRDESVHGVYVGLLAQEIFDTFSKEEQEEIHEEVFSLFHLLHENEIEYTKEVYAEIGLVDEVLAFIEYNANKAFMNLGYDPIFENVVINSIVENGLRTDTKNHDFFSVKGNGYVKATNVEPLTDSDFNFEDGEY